MKDEHNVNFSEEPIPEPIHEIDREQQEPLNNIGFKPVPEKKQNPFRKILKFISDVTFLPLTYLGGISLRRMRLNNFTNYPLNKKLLLKIGVFPVTDHYYEPLFNPKYLRKSLNNDRLLPSIDMNIEEQLALLKKFDYNKELRQIPIDKTDILEYYYNNYSFLSGDGEFLYNMVRYHKPRKIIEVGSGYSTLMAVKAIVQNMEEDRNYSCEFTCIEPYEHSWLEGLNVKVLRSLVEDVDLSYFESLKENDILFIDSSHIIKPQGDVLFLFLHVLPVLNPGVIIHIHDIFTPKDYLEEWILKKNRFWNEQYLVEAFLSYNDKFKVIGALNFLRHFYYQELADKCPVLKKQIEAGANREPGSLWIKKK